MTNLAEEMVRVSTTEMVKLIAIAAVLDKNWPGQAIGLRCRT